MKENKKKLGVIVISLVLMIGLVIGLTYAAFTYTSSGTQENIVSTTAVTMKYTEKTNGILLDNAMPTSDEVGKTLALDSNYAFYFTVSITTGSNTPIGYEVTAEKLTAKELFEKNLTDEDKEEDVELVKDDEVRLYLERSENNPDNYQSIMEPTIYTPLTESTPLGAQVGEMMLDFGTISETKTYHYILRMWVGENYNVDNIERYYGVRVNVYGTDSRAYSNTLTLNKNNIELEIDESEELTPTVTPENVTNADITWSSSDSTIATVDTLGNVTGVKAGTATITATTSKGRKATCIVTIKGKSPKSISGIEVDGSSLGDLDLTLTTDTEKVVGVNITPNDYDDSTYNVTWTTSDSDVVDIEEVTERTTGTSSNDETIIASKMASKNITANKVKLKAGNIPGNATITAIIKDRNNNDITKSFYVKVQYPDLESITLDKSSATIDVNDTVDIEATIGPDKVNNSKLYWSSSDESVAIVNCTETYNIKAKCTITGVSSGVASETKTATIIVTDNNGHTETSTIIVQNPIISNTISLGSDIVLDARTDSTLILSINPNEVRDVIYWSSSDDTIVNVKNCADNLSSCTIETLKTGEAYIKVTTKYIVDESEILNKETQVKVTIKSTLSNKIRGMLTEKVNDGVVGLSSADGTIIQTLNVREDGSVDDNVRYTISSSELTPNNYVNFNGEKWRIIGSFDKVKSSVSGNEEKRVKLIYDGSIGLYSWHTGNLTYGAGLNTWNDSDIMKLMNPNKYWNNSSESRTIGNSFYYNRIGDSSTLCYSGRNYSQSICNFSSNGLTTDAKNLITSSLWYLGASNSSTSLSPVLYKEERGNLHAGGQGNNPLVWLGEVGLAYPSDYSFSNYWCAKNVSFNFLKNCSSNWMYKGDSMYRFITVPESDNIGTWVILKDGSVSNSFAGGDGYGIMPTVYLKSNVIVKEDGADGSYEHPYNIELGS